MKTYQGDNKFLIRLDWPTTGPEAPLTPVEDPALRVTTKFCRVLRME